jgi:hypothetical protein
VAGVRIVVIEPGQELGGGAGLPLRHRPVDLAGCLAVIAAGVGFNNAGINGEAFTPDQAGIHAGPHHSLEHLAQDVAVTEAAMAIDRERRVIGHLVVEIEATKPAVRKVKVDLLAQPPLRADAITVADDQHPDHELRIDRGPADVAVEGRQLVTKLSQYPRHDGIDPPQKVANRDTSFEVEQVKQLALIAGLSTHHGKTSAAGFLQRTESLFAD